jgi:hypothetical protein
MAGDSGDARSWRRPVSLDQVSPDVDPEADEQSHVTDFIRLLFEQHRTRTRQDRPSSIANGKKKPSPPERGGSKR